MIKQNAHAISSFASPLKMSSKHRWSSRML